MVNEQQHNVLFRQTQTSQTGVQLYSDTSPYEISQKSTHLNIDLHLRLRN